MKKRQALKLARKERLWTVEGGRMYVEYIDPSPEGIVLSVWSRGMTANACHGRPQHVLHYMRTHRRTRMGEFAEKVQ